MRPTVFNQNWNKQAKKDRKKIHIYNNELV
jgi:hypothetical protein